MERYQGSAVSERIAIGTIYVYQKRADVPCPTAADEGAEIARFDAARAAVLDELDELCRVARERMGRDDAALFDGYRMLARDEMYRDYVCDVIHTEHGSAAYAVTRASAHFTDMLRATGDPLVAERAADVADISERFLRQLGVTVEAEDPREPSILAAEELTPGDLMRLEKTGVLALVLRRGSVHSHVAILARSMGIPALFGIDVQEAWTGHPAVVDGGAGELILDPDADFRARMAERRREMDRAQERRQALRDAPTVTRGGRRVTLCANIRGPEELDAARESGADGIGLLRSEFLYLAAADWPTEEQQCAAYTAVVRGMKGRRVVIRTLDVGADKQLPYLDLNETERGIGVCLARPEIFRIQLRAILRAALCGPVAVMFPMVTSVEEVMACREQLTRSAEELRMAQTPHGSVEVGVMIETPEAVAAASALAREVDFFSVGTNDLARRDPASVESALRTTAEAAHAAGIPVCVCGEMAADPSALEHLLELGVDELSVAPEAVLSVREAIRELP